MMRIHQEYYNRREVYMYVEWNHGLAVEPDFPAARRKRTLQHYKGCSHCTVLSKSLMFQWHYFETLDYSFEIKSMKRLSVSGHL